MDIKLDDVVKFKCEIDSNEKFGTIKSYTVSSKGMSYSVDLNDGSTREVDDTEILSKWVEFKIRKKKSKEN
jgi:hypothetical protein